METKERPSRRVKSDDQYIEGNIWFADRFHSWRASSGLTQAETARRLNTTRATISNWEYRSCAPHPYKIIDICKLFDITPNMFYGWTGDISPEYREAILLLSSLNKEGKEKVRDYAQLLLESKKFTDDK